MAGRRLKIGILMAGMAVGCAEVDRADRVEIALDTAVGGEAGETGVAFELAGPGGAALLVPVHVNGSGPYRFVLDTGATMTCIDGRLAARLELPEDGRVGVGMGIGQAAGALRLVAIDSLRVGEATALGLSGCALDLEQFQAMGLEVEGLLGLNYLREFRVTLDFRAERLTLERSPGPGM
jgi:predicted aspartyl protease